MTKEEIKSIRLGLGMSVMEFAVALGFLGPNAFVTIYRYESGKRKPGASTLKLLNQLKGGVRHVK